MKKEKSFVFFLAIFLLSAFVSASLVDDVIIRVNDVICIILCIIWYIVAALAALILVLAGIKYISSESPDDRDESRKRIFNALAGLIIVLIAMPFVNYLVQNTNIMAFKGCNCVFIPTNATTTTTLGITTTTTPHGGTTTTTEVTTTTTTPSGGTTTTTGGATTTTSGGIVECPETCINNNYLGGWKCKDACDPKPEEYDMGPEDCPSGKTCCCKPTTTTTTSTVITTTTTTPTTTTATTSTTTTTMPCAKPHPCDEPKTDCSKAQSFHRCWEQGDGLSLEKECGADFVNCCCNAYTLCCSN